MFTVNVHVEFPALEELVRYLKGRDVQQNQIDALSAQVHQMAEALNQSTTGLQAAVQTQEKS